MRASLQLRITGLVAVLLGIASLTSLYTLIRFHEYDSQVTRMMSGDQKTMLAGQLLESKVRAAEALIDASVSTTDGNDAFKDKFQSILSEYRQILGKDLKADGLEEARQAPEDLFIYYRNVKTAAFSVYRNAWTNKWMNVAHITGLILGDLDNLPYQDGEKAVPGIQAKVTQLSTFVTGTALANATKISILQQLGGLKAQAGKYAEAWGRSKKIKQARTDLLKKIGTDVKAWNEAQGKEMLKFVSGSNHDFLKGVLAFVFFLGASIAWSWIQLKKFSKHTRFVFADLARQIGAWIGPSGIAIASGIERPKQTDMEMTELYDAFDDVIKRVNVLRKEDVVVKRLLAVPFALISKAQKKAVYWNSALSILGKVRALEESGAVPYSNILRFSDVQGKALDPVERCFIEGREVVQLALYKAGPDSIATQITCTPVIGSDEETEYVLVQVRDIRDENRKLEAELDRQLDLVRAAAQDVAAGRVPAQQTQSWSRKPVMDIITALRTHVVAMQERERVLAGQLDAFWNRFEKETELKNSITKHIEAVHGETNTIRDDVKAVRSEAERIAMLFGELEQGEQAIASDYKTVRGRGERFGEDLKRTRDILSGCMKEILKAEDMAKAVRIHEKTIQALMQKSSLMHINNAILENNESSQIGPEHLIMITENLNQILVQFQRAYRLIETSVREIEGGFKHLGSRIREQIKSSIELVGEDQQVVQSVRDCARNVEENQRRIRDVMEHVGGFLAQAEKAFEEASAVGEKSGRMVEIARSSQALHAELGRGLKKAVSDLDARVANPQISKANRSM